MAEIKMIKERCPADHVCPATRVCPVGALKQDGLAAPTIDETKCTKCGKCTKICPRGALLFVKK